MVRANAHIYLMVLFLFALGINIVGQQSDEYQDQCQVENTAFQGGEFITYIIYYNWNFIWIPAGEVTFQVTDEISNYHFRADGITYPSYEWFFKVRDRYESYVEKETLKPIYFERDIEEGDYKFFNKVEFDHQSNKVTSYVGKTPDALKKQEQEVDACMQDLLSLIYQMRNIDTQKVLPGESFPVSMFIDHDQYDINVKMQGRKKKKHIKGLGNFDVLHICPELVAGNTFKENQNMDIWVSNDENRLPLMIESPVSVGSIKAVLKDYKGLRHPLTARL